MTYFINPAEQDIRFRIIRLLSEKYPLTAKEIHKLLTTEKTYQYVHKILSELADDGILTYENKDYALNVEWRTELKKFVILVDENYKLNYKMFSRRFNAEVLQFLDDDEKNHLIDDVNKLISHRVTHRLDEWYSRFYDPKEKEFNYIKSVADIDGKRILEIGCGTGRITKSLLRHSGHVTAIDKNEECINYCNEHYKNGTFIYLDARDLDKLLPKQFDVIISGWAGLHYLSDRDIQHVLGTMKRLLPEEGKLIILEAYYNTDYVTILDGLLGSKRHIKEHTLHLKEMLVETFDDVKEKVIMTEYVFPTYEDFENKFKFEVQYEHRVQWSEEHEKKLQDYIKSKEDALIVTEAPVSFVCS